MFQNIDLSKNQRDENILNMLPVGHYVIEGPETAIQPQIVLSKSVYCFDWLSKDATK